jgi:CRISPR/Cas system-associated protein endoribonuclease Cas2
MKRGLNYQFKLKDLSVYSRWLKPSDSDNKFERSALGKIVPEVSARRLRLANANYFDKLLKVLKNTDWQRTPLYHQYCRNGRWLHEDE